MNQAFLLRSTILLMSLMGLVPGLSEARDVVEIRFLPTPIVNDTVIRLGDIARVSTADQSLDRRLQDLVVGEAAPAGTSRLVSCESIVAASRLLGPVSLTFSSPEPVTVRTTGMKRTVGEFAPQIRKVLTDSLLWDPRFCTVSVENESREFCTIDAPIQARITTPQPLARAKGPVHLYLDVSQGNRQYHVPVVCRVTVKMPVVVTADKVERGEAISSAKCIVKEMDITNYRYTCYTAIDSVTSQVALRTLASGSILHDRNIRPVPLVVQGETVRLLAASGSVRISVTGRARESGILGQKIWVENELTQQLVRGAVTGKNEITLFASREAL